MKVNDSLLELNSGWLFNSLTPEWQREIVELRPQFDGIEEKLAEADFLPKAELIFSALSMPLDKAKVLIVGQDPYPNPEHAMGLAFSIPHTHSKLPPTLRNIFKELQSDLGGELRVRGDLSDWRDQGVVLLNRTLTLEPGKSDSHKDFGWDEVTSKIIEVLSNRMSVAILWGKSAQELAPRLKGVEILASPHPSPLSSYRGIFGSRPFSKANHILEKNGLVPISW